MQNDEPIPFNKPFLVGSELNNIADAVLVQNWISGNGTYTKRCTRWLEQHLGVPAALLTHSCTAALEMTALLAELEPGDEVIMPSFTFPSTANAYVLRGAVPVFVDIRADTLNIDETQIEAAITPRTRAIVIVHYAGYPCEMDTIMAIARRHDLIVIEDAAQALLSTYRGQQLGTFGTFSCLSFHETKNVISGEGGALLINDPKYIERAQILHEKGTNRAAMMQGHVDKYTWVDVGSSFMPGEIIAAFLAAQLDHADTIIARRQEIHERYRQRLLPLQDRVTLPLPCHEGNGHLFYILVATAAERPRLISYLRERKITAVFHYVPLHSAPAGVKFGRFLGNGLPVTDDISSRLLRLPVYRSMTDSDIDRVVDAVASFYGQAM